MKRKYRLTLQPCIACGERLQQVGAAPWCAACLRGHIREYQEEMWQVCLEAGVR
jgi:hypothetical protein